MAKLTDTQLVVLSKAAQRGDGAVEGAVGRFMLTQKVAVAELEAGLISARTKAALAAMKSRGI